MDATISHVNILNHSIETTNKELVFWSSRCWSFQLDDSKSSYLWKKTCFTKNPPLGKKIGRISTREMFIFYQFSGWSSQLSLPEDFDIPSLTLAQAELDQRTDVYNNM